MVLTNERLNLKNEYLILLLLETLISGIPELYGENSKGLKRKFITNLVLIILLNLLIKPLWIFGIDRNVQNLVGPAEFGLYGALLNLSFILNILLDFGITNYNNRNISQNHQLLRKYFSNIVVLRFLLAVVYAIMSFWSGSDSGLQQP